MQRRRLLQGAAGAAGLAVAGARCAPFAIAQPAKLRVGLMLPFTGALASQGNAISNGFKLCAAERRGRLGGRELEYIVLDDESDAAKAVENASRMVNRDRVDVLVGTVDSEVQIGMLKVVRESDVLSIIPHAGANAATGRLCAPNIFRSSFTHWQTIYPLGKVMMEKGHKSCAWIGWKTAAGEEMFGGFKEGYRKAGGRIAKELWLPFPGVEFRALFAGIAATGAEAVACFFAGDGAVRFVKEYAAAGLKGRLPLYANGSLTDGTLPAQGAAAQGIYTTLHYADGLELLKDKTFRLAYAKAYGRQPGAYAVQGYDAAQMLDAGLSAAKGDIKAHKQIIAAIEKATIDSPRGRFTISTAHNPVQDIYLRQVVGESNKFVGVAWKNLADPARGCKMA